MTDQEAKLSAFLDGELPEDEARAIEDALTSDPALQAELEALMAADEMAKDAFAQELEEPVPFDLAAAINAAPVAQAANVSTGPGRSSWMSVAAALLFLIVGGAGGYFAGLSQGGQGSTTPVWLADIADYHAVYAAETRHLVEVPANEADHIVAWLTKSVGTEVRIPDLTENGLKFEGGRLLVAAGKPVAQLMYTDNAGDVVALCLIRSTSPSDGFTSRTINGFDMISWGGQDANIVVVGPEGRENLQAIAETASVQI